MAEGYLMLSNRNLKREYLNSEDSDYNFYSLFVGSYHFKIARTESELMRDTSVMKCLPKIIIIEPGTYHATDGSMWDERDIIAPLRLDLSQVRYGLAYFKGNAYNIIENGTPVNKQVTVTFSFPYESVIGSEDEDAEFLEYKGNKLDIKITIENVYA